ncbi:MAG: hypothetical protein DWQ05_05010 [Calditrichaeota bacterium]|nr:MAG: hypothetical protein DWQ05_05010 [Calditrichota bacterium]
MRRYTLQNAVKFTRRIQSITCLPLWLVLFSTTQIAAQDQPQSQQIKFYSIVDIQVSGNKKTKPAVILREMRTQIGDTVSAADLQYDARRIESLGLFTRVDISLESQENGVALLIDVTEQWYIFPFPIFYFNDREYTWEKASYGMSLLHTNFRGNAETLACAAWAGYNPGTYLTYSIPAINGNKHYFLSARFFLYHVRSKSLEILNLKTDENQIGSSVSFGRRLNLENSVQISLGFSRIKYDPPVRGQTLNPSGTDNLPSISFNFSHNSRDLAWYPRRGSLLSISYQKTGFWNDAHIDYRHLYLDYRFYHPILKDLIFATRYTMQMSDGALPVYNRAYFGYTTRIRGRFDERYEGENRMFASFELRFPIIPVRYIQLEEKSLRGYGRNLKFGISGSFFMDMGSLWVQSQNLGRYTSGEQYLSSGYFGLQTRPTRWLRGYGAGLNFHLPYVNIVRLELGFDDDLNTEFIFDAQMSF